MRSIGYAFIHVSDFESAHACILNLSGTMLFGKRLFVGWARNVRKVLFGNVENCEKEVFFKLIRTMSKVKDMGLAIAGGGNVHFAVVTFETHEDAKRVMQYFQNGASKRLSVCARWLYFFPCPWNSEFVRTRHPIEF